MSDPLVLAGEKVKPIVELHHPRVERAEVLIAEMILVSEAPLPPCVLAGPSVPVTGEVDPLWVAKFIAHEVQVSLGRVGEDVKGREVIFQRNIMPPIIQVFEGLV